MRFFAQMLSCLGLCAAFLNRAKDVNFEQPIYTNAIQRYDQNNSDDSTKKDNEVKALKKVFLSSRTITCNDGSQAGFYLRKSHSSTKWIIFLEGGWYCYDHRSCRNRWLKQRHFMTSSHWPDTKDVRGILSPIMEENPYWWNYNHVFVPYCTSDSWSGSRPGSPKQMFSFMGSFVIRQVIRDLLPLGLENSTELLLTGSSAGGTGVMLNLDFVKELLHEELSLKQIHVKGVSDSGWFLDRTPFTPTNKHAVDALKKGMELWRGKVPRVCREKYLDEPWRCYFGYRIYPTLKTDLFVFQWLFDEAQIDADNVGAPVTKQQWDYIHKMGDALRQSFENVSAVFAPSCVSHAVLTKKDWQDVKIDDISTADALHCWEQKVNRRRMKKLKNMENLSKRLSARRRKKQIRNLQSENVLNTNDNVPNTPVRVKKRKNKKNKGHKRHKDNDSSPLVQNGTQLIKPNKGRSTEKVQSRSPHNSRKRRNKRTCVQRRLERCSWPQCNHSCPKLHNPVTGEEMDFIELLKSFGLEMESVANALGIDMQTLNNMDQGELLNLLTQQSNNSN